MQSTYRASDSPPRRNGELRRPPSRSSRPLRWTQATVPRQPRDGWYTATFDARAGVDPSNVDAPPNTPLPLPTPDPGEPYPAPGGARPAPDRPWVHGLLLAATALTVMFSGSLWEGAYEEAGSLIEALAIAIAQPGRLARGLPFALSVLAILGAHEMGHYLACRRHGIRATLPYFIPGPPPFGTFGAVIRIRGRIPDRRALLDVAAAGPLAGFCVALPLTGIGLLCARPIPPSLAEGGVEFGSPLVSAALERLLYGGADLAVGSVYLAGWFGMLVTSLNLFPAGQLDGGHAVYALSASLHRRMAWTTIAALFAFVVVRTILDRALSAYTLWCVILILMRDRHPRLSDEIVTLDPRRRLVAWLLLAVFLLSFIPVPIRW